MLLMFLLVIGNMTKILYATKNKNPLLLEKTQIGQLPPFKFQDLNKKEFSNSDIAGHITLMNFFFTSCPSTCPTMSKELNALQDEYSSSPLLNFVSISVDPETDTFEKLQEFATRYNAKPGRWHILRGELQTVIDFAVKGLHLGVGENPDMHAASFALVDKDQNIRGYFRATEPEQMKKLRSAIDELLR